MGMIASGPSERQALPDGSARNREDAAGTGHSGMPLDADDIVRDAEVEEEA
jgi:hypothetical protein